MDIVDIVTEYSKTFISKTTGYTTVWSDSEKVFIGTHDSGIKFFLQSDVIYPNVIPTIYDFVEFPDLTDNDIRYIHGNSNKLICCTVDGVDVIRRDTGYRTYTEVSGAMKCFITPKYDYLFYVVSGTNSWTINRLNNNTSNWTTPDIVYTTGEGFLSEDSIIYDIFVTEHTSIISEGLDNTLFIATDKAVVVYDCGTMESIRFVTKSSESDSNDFDTNKRKALIFGDYWRGLGISGAYSDSKRVSLIYGYY